MSIEPTFLPLFASVPCEAGIDPFDRALLLAAQGCHAGKINYSISKTAFSAGFAFAPDVQLIKSLAMFPLWGVSFQNALGALAPPEVAVHLEWN